MASAVDRGVEERALSQLKRESDGTQCPQDLGFMAKVKFELGRELVDFIDVNRARLSHEPRKDYIDGPLERRRGVDEPKGNFGGPEFSSVARERRLVAVFVSDAAKNTSCSEVW